MPTRTQVRFPIRFQARPPAPTQSKYKSSTIPDPEYDLKLTCDHRPIPHIPPPRTVIPSYCHSLVSVFVFQVVATEQLAICQNIAISKRWQPCIVSRTLLYPRTRTSCCILGSYPQRSRTNIFRQYKVCLQTCHKPTSNSKLQPFANALSTDLRNMGSRMTSGCWSSFG